MSDPYATYAARLMSTQPIRSAHVPPEHVVAVLRGMADHTAIMAMLMAVADATTIGRWYHGLADAIERAR